MHEKHSRVNKFKTEFTAKTGKSPTNAEISKNTNIPINILERIANNTNNIIGTLEDLQPYTRNDYVGIVDSKILKEHIDSAIDSLTDLERTIIRCRFYQNLTLFDTGVKVGYTKEYVRLVQNKALDKLKKKINTDKSIDLEGYYK